jgi:hypothetical protein
LVCNHSAQATLRYRSDRPEAIRLYRLAVEEIDKIFGTTNELTPELHSTLLQYRTQVQSRYTYLEQLPFSQQASAIDSHITPLRDASQPSGASRALTGAAAIGGAAGLVVGGPLLAAVGAGAMAFGATKDNAVGGSVRAVGSGAAEAATRAVELGQQHDVAGRVHRASTVAVEKVQNVNAQYDISGKAAIAPITLQTARYG